MAVGKILGTPNPAPKNVGITQEEKDALATFVLTVETHIAMLIDFANTLGSRIVRLEELTGVGEPEDEDTQGAEDTPAEIIGQMEDELAAETEEELEVEEAQS